MLAGVDLVTVDQGNSSAKLGLWSLAQGSPPRLRARARLEGGRHLSEAQLEERLAPLREVLEGQPHAVLMSSVAAEESAAELAWWLERALGRAPETELDCGLEIECRNVHTIGRDRLFAARGALELGLDEAVVVDVGTAMTVDAMRAIPQAGGATRRGRFLGGAIAPGPWMLRDALARGGAWLWEVELDPRCPALGAETSEALASGVVHGLRGAAAELARRVGLEAGCAGAVRVVTGGAARFLLEPDPFWSGHVREEPELVALGLIGAWRTKAEVRT